MKKRTQRIALVTLASYITLFSSRPAHAYLDPSSGSLLLQVILGGTAGLAILGKIFWNRFKELFQFRKHKNADDKKTDV